MESGADFLAVARAKLEDSHTLALSSDAPRVPIRDSWQRCLNAGLDPIRIPMAADTSAQELKQLMDQEALLLRLARSEFRTLQSQLAGDNCLLGFANRDAVLMDVVCSNPGIRSASRAVPGSCWSESCRGTNAIGTAAFTRRPVSVITREHFLRDYASLVCIAATVSNPDGELAGILHVSSTFPIREHRTMSLLCMSARRIESELLREKYRGHIVLQFHSRVEFADTLEAGLIAIDEEGTVLSCNQQARVYLEGLPLEPGRHFDEIFQVPFRQFLSRRQLVNGFTQLVDAKGSTSAARIHVPANAKRSWPGPNPAFRPVKQERQAAGFVMRDQAVSRAVSLVQRGVGLSVPILICGETGTGKEVLAQYAHRCSGRQGRFIAVNCAAFPESLIESELFGYREGSFTGARPGGSEGLILQADGGTLFLDEIGDMPMNLQPALLRFLDSYTVRPIGSNREVKVDLQLVTATNCDLEHAISERKFRRDLLYRINSLEILLPPLRARSDFDEVVYDLLGRIYPRLEISGDAMSLLREQRWDGNIRELNNILIRASLNCSDGYLSRRELQPFLRSHLAPIETHHATPVLAEVRRRTIVNAYELNDGNISRTARTLNISRNTLYRELRLAGVIVTSMDRRSGADRRNANSSD